MPVGVASVWWDWLIIVPLLVGYSVYRWAYARELRKQQVVFTTGLLDRMALTSLVAMTGGAVLVGTIFFGLGNVVRWGELFLIFGWILLIYFTIRLLFSVMEKLLTKSAVPAQGLRRSIVIATVAAYILAPILAVAVFSGQGYAYNWFTTLLVPG